MNDFTTSVLTALVEGIDLREVFRTELEKCMNLLLETERTAFLGFEKWDPSGYNTGNSRNGYYTRTLKTEFGTLSLQIPRDRKGNSTEKTTSAYLQNHNRLEDTILLLYQKGITTREISDLIEKMYGQHYSAQTVSNLSGVLETEVQHFQQRRVQKRYVALYCDATFLPVRRGSVSKEALHLILGIDEEGHKEVLSFALYPTESSTNYREMLQDLKRRGLEEVLLFVIGELTGLPVALTEEFPQAKHQSCWTHLLRSISAKVRACDTKSVLADLKQVYRQESISAAQEELTSFLITWGGKYPKVQKSLESKENLFSFMLFPKEIWRSLYTNNLSENFNKQMKRRTKVKEQFPSEASLEKAIYCYVTSYNEQFAQRVHRGFGLVQYELSERFQKTMQTSEEFLPSPMGEDGVQKAS